MLEQLRQQSQTPWGRALLASIFGLLGLAFFITFGPSGRLFQPGSKADEYAAKVNGEEISRVEFERFYYRQVRQFGQMDQATLDRLIPRSRVLDEMIKERLVSEAALRDGVDVSDKELRDDILKDPSFQEDGKFSNERYELVVNRSLGISVEQYEEDMRRQLRSMKMADMLRETAKVSDADLKRQFADENEKVNLRYVRFSPAFYTNGVTVSDAEVQALLKDHLSEVQEAYKKQSAMYHSGKQAQARHILIKVPAGNKDADAAAQARLAKLKADLEKGGDFASVAKTQSQASDAAKGGELGMVRQGAHLFDPAIEGAALATAEGKISDPVRSKQGWELVQTEKVIPAADHPFEEVKTQVARDVLVKQRALAKAEEVAKQAQTAMMSGKHLDQLFPASDKPDTGSIATLTGDHPVSEETGAFARSSMAYIPKLGQSAELQRTAFEATPGKPLAGPTKISDAYVVTEVVGHEQPDMVAFEKQKDDLRENALRRSEVELMQDLKAKLRSTAVVEINGAVLGPPPDASGQQG